MWWCNIEKQDISGKQGRSPTFSSSYNYLSILNAAHATFTDHINSIGRRKAFVAIKELPPISETTALWIFQMKIFAF